MSTSTPVAYAPPCASTSALKMMVTRNVMRREERDERPGGPRPFGRHAVARQVPGHEVEQARHGRGAGEPQDRDRADVVDGAEHIAEIVVGEVREGAARRFAALRQSFGGNQERRHERAADEQHAHDQRSGAEQFPGVPNAARRALRRCRQDRLRRAASPRRRSRTRKGRARALGRRRSATSSIVTGCRAVSDSAFVQRGRYSGCASISRMPTSKHDHVEGQIDGHDHHREADRLAGSPSGRPRRAPPAARA